MEPFADLMRAALGPAGRAAPLPAPPANATAPPADATVPRLAVAVSGGPDSVALLHLAVAAFPGNVTALTVDHGLRAAAADEAATLARLCAAADIPHVTLRWDDQKPASNLQAAARAARYRLMAGWCAGHGVPLLATAHHADDQAETLLMRLARGSGSGGLAGIRACRPLGHGVTLVRPLLGVRRAELAGIAAATGWPLVDDPTNRDRRHDRTAARALLAATPWLDPARLAAAAAHLADAEAALAWTVERAWAGRAVIDPAGLSLDVAGLPVELVRRLVARAVTHLCPGATLRGPDVARLVAALAQGRRATLAGVIATGGPLWRFKIAPPRRADGWQGAGK
jgi:tRNA(Ile)-lysidine synthase